MNLFEKIGLVERVEPDVSSMDMVDVETVSDAAPVQTPETATEEEIIDAIYSATQMTDKSVSVYKVEELAATIPPEVPESTSKVMVVNLLHTLGLSIDSIFDDAQARIAALTETFNATIADNQKQQEELTDHINALKEQIESDKMKIQSLVQSGNELESAVKKEKAKISSILSFIGADKKDTEVVNAAQ